MEGPLGDGYDVVVCKGCGAGFADGIPSQRKMDRYYAEQSKYAYEYADGAESRWDIGRFDAIAEKVTPHIKWSESKILDIGCATGGLLSVFKRRGFKNVIGVDPSPSCVAAAARLHGVEVRTATIARLADWDERFDVILMVGVLEHLRDVKDAVRIATRLLMPDGVLFCAVPDVDGLAYCRDAPYQQFSFEHVNFFSSRSLKRLMAECGMVEKYVWNWNVEWREGVIEPIASGLFSKDANRSERIFDDITGRALERYLEFSKKADQRIIGIIETLRVSQEPILVWGTGTLARRLLATTRFSELNITAFVDSNIHNEGKSLANRPILAPTKIRDRKERILICSVTFSKEIAQSIRFKHGISIPPITFE